MINYLSPGHTKLEIKRQQTGQQRQDRRIDDTIQYIADADDENGLHSDGKLKIYQM